MPDRKSLLLGSVSMELVPPRKNLRKRTMCYSAPPGKPGPSLSVDSLSVDSFKPPKATRTKYIRKESVEVD